MPGLVRFQNSSKVVCYSRPTTGPFSVMVRSAPLNDAGTIRQIPFYWRVIDCSFGVLGIIPLLLVRKDIAILETMEQGRRR